MLVSKESRASDSPVEPITRGSQILSQRNDGKLTTQDKLKKLILFSLTFMIVELVGGYISNSIAVISDALHMFTDLLGYLVQLGSAFLAVRSRNSAFTFGYSRAESLGALFNCALIWGITAYLVFEAVARLIHPPEDFEPRVMLFTAFFGVLLNLAMGVIVVGAAHIGRIVAFWREGGPEQAEHAEDFNLRATIMHIRGDMVYSVGVFISAVLINIFPTARFFDSVCTMLFSYVVLGITRPLFASAIGYVLEAVPEGGVTRAQH